MTDQDKILQFIQSSGPTIPSKVAKHIGSDILIASAHLADLSSQKKLEISKLKIGGSPLYFLKGQESQLYNFAAGNINPKNLVVLDKLKENKVLKESNLDLLEKVALRSLKDFAVPLQVRTASKVELFWKWHLVSPEETNDLITKKLQPKPTFKEPEEVIPLEPVQDITPPLEEKPEPLPPPQPVVTESKPLDVKEQEIVIPEEPEQEVISTPLEAPKQEVKLEPEKPELEELIEKPVKVRKKRTVKQETFLPILEDFFRKLDIVIHEKETVRKNSELNFVITVPSAVGSMKYFCKAKSKKRCDEKDVSAAYMEAQIKKMPLLFLYSDQLNQKAQEMLESDAFETAIVKKIE